MGKMTEPQKNIINCLKITVPNVLSQKPQILPLLTKGVHFEDITLEHLEQSFLKKYFYF
jgi:hypothetical protein